MKLNIFLLLTFLIGNNIFSQKIDNMEYFNNKYTFGSNPTQIENLEFDRTIIEGVDTYNLINQKTIIISGVKVEKVSLLFYKDKLTTVEINFGSFRANDNFSDESFTIIENSIPKMTKEIIPPKSKDILKMVRYNNSIIEYTLQQIEYKGYVLGYILLNDINLSNELMRYVSSIKK